MSTCVICEEPLPAEDGSGLCAAHTPACSREALERCRSTFQKWLGKGYDTGSLDAVLCTAAVERLDGDPLWILVISGPGNAKTETVVSLAGIGAHIESTITSEGALISGTHRNGVTKKATGGLLRKIGTHGVLVIKDVTSILSMQRDSRASVLGALREVYDGYWSRNLGTDGGQTLLWEGRICVVGAVTTAWDSHHAVISVMGDRFVLIRTNSDEAGERRASGRQALDNIGSEVEMRTELAQSVKEVIDAMAKRGTDLTELEMDSILDAADLVTRARTAVERDFKGEALYAHAMEAPTRLAKQLGQVVRGGVAIGMTRPEANRLAIRCARDSVPPIRMRIIDDLAAFALTEEAEIGMYSVVADIRRRVDLPRTTTDRELQMLHLLRLVE